MPCPPIAAHRWSPSPRTRWCSPTLLLIDRPGPPDALALPLVLAMAFASPLGALLLLEVVPGGQPVPSVHLKWQHRKTLKNNTKHKNFELKTITLKWRNSQVNSQVNLSESNPQVNSQSEWNPQVNSQSEWPPKWSLKVNETLKWTLRMKMKPSSELSKWRQHSRNKIVNEVVVKHSRNTRLWQWPSTWLSLLPLGQHHLNQHLELPQTLELPQALAWPWPLVLPQLEQLPPRHLLCPWMHTYIFATPPSLSLSLTLSLSLSCHLIKFLLEPTSLRRSSQLKAPPRPHGVPRPAHPRPHTPARPALPWPLLLAPILQGAQKILLPQTWAEPPAEQPRPLLLLVPLLLVVAGSSV